MAERQLKRERRVAARRKKIQRLALVIIGGAVVIWIIGTLLVQRTRPEPLVESVWTPVLGVVTTEQLAYTNSGTEYKVVRLSEEKGMQDLTRGTGKIVRALLSENGQQLLLAVRVEGVTILRSVDMQNGLETQLVSLVRPLAFLSWSPSGQKIVYAEEPVVPTTAVSTYVLQRNPESHVVVPTAGNYPTWSGEKTLLWVTPQSATSIIQFYDVEKKNVVSSLTFASQASFPIFDRVGRSVYFVADSASGVSLFRWKEGEQTAGVVATMGDISGSDVAGLSLSPDGKIALVATRRASIPYFVVNLQTSDVVPLAGSSVVIWRGSENWLFGLGADGAGWTKPAPQEAQNPLGLGLSGLVSRFAEQRAAAEDTVPVVSASGTEAASVAGQLLFSLREDVNADERVDLVLVTTTGGSESTLYIVDGHTGNHWQETLAFVPTELRAESRDTHWDIRLTMADTKRVVYQWQDGQYERKK